MLFCVAALAQEPPNIAVYVTGDVSDNEKKALGTHILAALANSGRYKGIERSNAFLAEIDKEQEKQRSGAIDDNQISQLGKQFGVKFICIADITPAYDGFQVSARIVNVETAEVALIGQATSRLKTINDFTKVSDRVVKRMFGEPSSPDGIRKIRLSIGAGGFFASDFGGGLVWPSGDRVAMPYYGGGAYLFLDAIYAEIFAGLSGGGGKWASAHATDKNELADMPRSYLNFGVFAKYPVTVWNVKMFPLLGVDYESSLSGRIEFADGYGWSRSVDANSLSALWVKFGGGVDCDLGKSVYLRSELLYGLRTPNRFEKDYIDEEKNQGVDAKTGLGHGLTFKAGVGVKF